MSQMTVEQVNEYMKKQCGFVPRMFQIINTVTPEPGRTFADFYASIFGDGALSRKHKELMFMSGGVAIHWHLIGIELNPRAAACRPSVRRAQAIAG